jgi:hypothetical protein
MSKARPMVTPVVADPGTDLRDHPLAGHHREGDVDVESPPGRLPRAARGHEPEIKAAVETLFKVKVTGQHAAPGRQEEGLPGRRGQRSDYKKAMVTLAEGHTIDVTTGVSMAWR